jgi:hypothetical protein
MATKLFNNALTKRHSDVTPKFVLVLTVIGYAVRFI